ncbi:hypothetical protein N7G274_004156 [Stereocaulon virgatum]|uniref:Uncharacterized protein n=1 Tax=Stereocaulon virgatum TaxID=373712 RepID=A0ABR4ADZ0_9LECA
MKAGACQFSHLLSIVLKHASQNDRLLHRLKIVPILLMYSEPADTTGQTIDPVDTCSIRSLKYVIIKACDSSIVEHGHGHGVMPPPHLHRLDSCFQQWFRFIPHFS